MFATVVDDALTPLKVPRMHARELRALLRLRDQARALVTSEARESEDTRPELGGLADLTVEPPHRGCAAVCMDPQHWQLPVPHS
ncbi:hypothetical protein ASF76_03375 [Microbacterium sp. Leaf151]|nr:hypothetical protein ASF76_03375 [Microbacterium sp. Leaf151]